MIRKSRLRNRASGMPLGKRGRGSFNWNSGNPYGALAGYEMYWKCDDGSGNNFADASPNAQTLTQMNTVGSVAGMIGNARSFVAASSQYAIRNDEAILKRNKDWTIAFWFYHTTVPGWQILVSKDDGLANREFLCGLNPGGVLELQVIGTTIVTHGTVLSAATWYHLTITWNNTTKGAQLILNAGTPATGTGGSAILPTTAPWQLGAYSVPQSLYHNGYIDDMVVWPSVLSSDLVTLNYNRRTPLV